MNKNKTFVRIVAAILVLLMVGGVLVDAFGSMASATSTITALKKQQDQLKEKKKALQEKIKSAEYEQATVIAKKKLLDEQMDFTLEDIEATAALIDEYTALIAQTEIDITETQKKEEEQWANYKLRVRAMEESGSISYLDVIFTATDFSDLLSLVDSVSEVMDKDKRIYEELVQTRNDLIQLKEEKENAVIEQEAKKAELVEKENELADQIENANKLIKQYTDNMANFKDDIKEIDAENKRLEEQIKEAERVNSPVVGEGNFIWPARGGYITSPYGSRNSPTAGASTFHKGIDIGGLGYGADILASKSGTVTTSAYSSSYGHYVMINHGDGTVTLYAHMQKRLVSAGQAVYQGQVIGLVGSTGISNGPHIHFEIRVNGTRVNPSKYV